MLRRERAAINVDQVDAALPPPTGHRQQDGGRRLFTQKLPLALVPVFPALPEDSSHLVKTGAASVVGDQPHQLVHPKLKKLIRFIRNLTKRVSMADTVPYRTNNEALERRRLEQIFESDPISFLENRIRN